MLIVHLSTSLHGQPEAEQISQKANRVVFYPKPLTAGYTEGFTLPETLAVLYERGSQVLAVAIIVCLHCPADDGWASPLLAYLCIHCLLV